MSTSSLRRAATIVTPLVVALCTCAWLYQLFEGLPAHLFNSVVSGVDTGGYDGPTYLGSDSVQVFYLSWKLKMALLHGWFSPLVDGFNFAQKNGVLYDFHIGVQYWINALSSVLLGNDVAGYNVGMLFVSTALTVCTGYLLFFTISRSLIFSALAAATLALVPHRVSLLAGGHGIHAALFLCPLYWAAILRHRSSLGTQRWAVTAGVTLLVSLISEEHLGYYLLLSSAFVFVVWLLQDFAAQGWQRGATLTGFVRHWVALAVAVAAVVGYALLLRSMVLSAAPARPADEVAVYSVPLSAFLEHDGIHNLFATLIPTLAVALLLALTLRPRPDLRRSPYLAFAVTGALFIVLSAGVGVHWSQRSHVYQLFMKSVPFFKYQRIPTKMYVITVPFVLLCLAGFWAWARSLSRNSRGAPRYSALALCMVCLVGVATQCYEFVRVLNTSYRFPYYSRMDLGTGATLDQLKGETTLQNDIVLALPIATVMDRYATYPQFLAYRTERRFVSGYFGQPPPWFTERLPALAAFDTGEPTTESWRALRELGVTKVLLDKIEIEHGTPTLIESRLRAECHLRFETCDATHCLFAMAAEASGCTDER